MEQNMDRGGRENDDVASEPVVGMVTMSIILWLLTIAAIVWLLCGCAVKAGHEVARDMDNRRVVVEDADVEVDPSLLGENEIEAPTSQPHQQSGVGLNYQGGDRTYGSDIWMPRAALGLVLTTMVLSHMRELKRIKCRTE